MGPPVFPLGYGQARSEGKVMLLSEAAVLPRRPEASYDIAAAIAPLCATCHFQKLNFCGALLRHDERQDWEPLQARHKAIVARHNIYRAGEPSEGVQVVCDGWAVRFIQLPNGKRQILSVIMPGDLISPMALFEQNFSYSVQAVTDVRYATFPFAEVRKRMRENPALFDLWIRLTAAEHRHADRRLVDLGQRTAQERIAGLIVHVMQRAQARGDIADDIFTLPMNQQQIADFTGLTPVHTCRVLSALRKAKVCDVGHGLVKVIDSAELLRIAAFK
jgi:CRP-like cAMP-binding protein